MNAIAFEIASFPTDWDVESHRGLERDNFDRSAPHKALAQAVSQPLLGHYQTRHYPLQQPSLALAVPHKNPLIKNPGKTDPG